MIEICYYFICRNIYYFDYIIGKPKTIADAMKPLVEKFSNAPNTSFSAKMVYLPYHDPFLHIHDDYELVSILNARGKRFIGDHVEEFSGNEVVLVAPHLPHCWHIAGTVNGKKTKAIVVHFSKFFLGKEFLMSPELSCFFTMLQQAERGMLIKGYSVRQMIMRMKSLPKLKGLKRLLVLLEIFEIISSNQDYQLLASVGYMPKTGNSDYGRINKIYEFVSRNYTKPLNLKDVADLVHLSPAAFCRYFKKSTQKTFFDFLKEIRIGHASKLLRESNLNISEICYASGYNNVANFNRQFKQLKAFTPKTYRANYQKNQVT